MRKKSLRWLRTWLALAPLALACAEELAEALGRVPVSTDYPCSLGCCRTLPLDGGYVVKVAPQKG